MNCANVSNLFDRICCVSSFGPESVLNGEESEAGSRLDRDNCADEKLAAQPVLCYL